jgi:hypothetical protein
MVLRQLRERSHHDRAALGLLRRVVDDLVAEDLRGVLVLGQRRRGAGLAPPQAVQAGVDHDPVQPGRDRGLAPVAVRPAVGGDERVLDGVGRFLAVCEGAQCDRP